MNVDAETVDRVVGCVHQCEQGIGQREPDLLHPPAQAAPAVRLGAIRTVLELGMKLREVADLEERLTALERSHENNGAAYRRKGTV